MLADVSQTIATSGAGRFIDGRITSVTAPRREGLEYV